MFARHVAIVSAAFLALVAPVRADERGVSFWVPGFFGSFAAVPAEPGWSFAGVFYQTKVSSGANVPFTRGGGGVVDLGLGGQGDLLFLIPSYTLSEPVLGGRASISLLIAPGTTEASVDATLTGPNGNTVSGRASQTVTGFGDLIPQLSLKWNDGVNNYMTYLTGDIPVGNYAPKRLANLGIGHGAIDGGVGYTYLDIKTGREFSIAGGLTYNFENPDTQYKNGIDSHIDMAVSQFVNKQVNIGAVGYIYQQLTGDSGQGAVLGPFESRVFGVGPQIGYKFALDENTAGYLNLKGYYEFDSKHRPEGWNVWLTLSFSPAPPK